MSGANNKKLIDLTNAYLAIEDLLKSRFVSDETRHKLEESMRQLDLEAKRLMQEHYKSEPDSKSQVA